MTKTFTTPRERAEAAFGKAQTQSQVRSRIVSEADAVVLARDEKTSRLRALRLAKEADGLADASGNEAKQPEK